MRDFDSLSQKEILALALPEHYPNGAPKISVPLPSSIDTLPLFGAGTASERYPD